MATVGRRYFVLFCICVCALLLVLINLSSHSSHESAESQQLPKSLSHLSADAAFKRELSKLSEQLNNNVSTILRLLESMSHERARLDIRPGPELAESDEKIPPNGEDLRQVVGLSSQRCLDRNPSYPDNAVKLYICHGGLPSVFFISIFRPCRCHLPCHHVLRVFIVSVMVPFYLHLDRDRHGRTEPAVLALILRPAAAPVGLLHRCARTQLWLRGCNGSLQYQDP